MSTAPMPTRCCRSSRATSWSPRRRTRSRARSRARATSRPSCCTCHSSTRNAARSRSRGRRRAMCSAVHIHSIKPRGPQPVGTTALIPEFGGLVVDGQHGAAQRAAAGEGQEDGGDRAGHQIQQQDHPALRAVHRHARRLAGDRGGHLAAAGLLGRQHGPARRGAGGDRLFPGPPQGRLSLSRRLPRARRATASCAASRSRCRRRRRSRST